MSVSHELLSRLLALANPDGGWGGLLTIFAKQAETTTAPQDQA